MRNITLILAVLLIISGCGGGGHLNSGNSSPYVTANGKVAGSFVREVEEVTVYEQDHVGEADHLVATASISNENFTLSVPEPGVYDIFIKYRYGFSDMINYISGEDTLTKKGVQFTYPKTDLGVIEIDFPVP